MLDIYLSNEIRVSGLPYNAAARITNALSILNPKFLENKKYGRWNGNTKSLLKYYKIVKSTSKSEMIIPRGFAFHLLRILKEMNIAWNIIDSRLSLPGIAFNSQINLKNYQLEAVSKILKKDFGVLSAPTGSGKTVMACHLIAERKQPTLVIVHTKELLNQWIARVETFLGVPCENVGIIGSGKYSFGDITISLVQTLAKRDLCDIAKHFGHVIVDECHRIPSRTFADVLSHFSGKYQLGLSATPYRSDGLSKLILYYVGNVVHEISETSLVETGQILRAEIVSRETSFSYDYKDETDYQPMISAMITDKKRNMLIASDVAAESQKGEYCIILSDRRIHCHTLGEMLINEGVDCSVLIGETPKHEREDIISRLDEGSLRVVVATGQLLGEGFDCKKLSRIFLTIPMSYKGRIKQYIGRVLRTCHGKDGAKVYDYVDSEVGVLHAMYKTRNNVLTHLS